MSKKEAEAEAEVEVEVEEKQLVADLSKNLKEGERIVAPTRRPDGTLRKPIRIRAGYVPQDEVAIYQSKGARVSTPFLFHFIKFWFLPFFFNFEGYSNLYV